MSDSASDESVFIGCIGYGPEGRTRLRHGTLMELHESFIAPPKLSTLNKWRAEAPEEDFAFSLRAWQVITHGAESPAWARLPKRYTLDPHECGFFRPTEAVEQAYGAMLQCAEALGARALLFDTPASFTPTLQNQRQLTGFFERARRPADLDLVWEARGVWSNGEIRRVCDQAGLIPAIDPVAREWWPESEIAYIKLAGARYSESELEIVAENLEDYARAYCVFAGASPLADLQRFQRHQLDVI